MAKFQLIVNQFGLSRLRFKMYPPQKKGMPPNEQPISGLPTTNSFPKVGDSAYDRVMEIERRRALENERLFERFDTRPDDVEPLTYLGTPVFADLSMQLEENSTGINLETVLIEVGHTKNIITTSVQGRRGTVKEYISDGDYDINIKGVIVNPNGDSYPRDDVRALLRYLRHNDSIVLVSPYLQLFEIFNAVVMDYRLPQLEGYQNMQPFEINCLSDVPIELIEDV